MFLSSFYMFYMFYSSLSSFYVLTYSLTYIKFYT